VLGNDDDLLVVLSVSKNEFYDCEIHFELSVIQFLVEKVFEVDNFERSIFKQQIF
jgi:hypothetical protein